MDPDFGRHIAREMASAVFRIIVLAALMGLIVAAALVYWIPWFLAHIRLGWV